MSDDLDSKVLERIDNLTVKELIILNDLDRKYGNPIYAVIGDRLKIHFRVKSSQEFKDHYFKNEECYFTKFNPEGKVDYYFHLD